MSGETLRIESLLWRLGGGGAIVILAGRLIFWVDVYRSISHLHVRSCDVPTTQTSR
jgi:hypothetical protein